MDGRFDERNRMTIWLPCVSSTLVIGGRLTVQHLGDIVLPAVREDMLVEISFRFIEPHSHKGDSQVAALF